MNIVVLAGGLSPERDVSLSSGCLIANALTANGHKALLADLYMGLPGAVDFAKAFNMYSKEKYEFKIPEREPDLDAIRNERRARGGMGGGLVGGGVGVASGGNRNDPLIGEGILEVCADADITFNALHGAIGENGQLQAVFDIFGIKYTGTGYDGCFMSMDKPLAKEIMRNNGVRTPDWIVFETGGGSGCDNARGDDICGDIPGPLGFPCVVKPCGCGSSVGVTIVEDRGALEAAVKYAREYEARIIIEKKVTGREFSVGVLGNEALPPIEIIPRKGFYDYKNKYQADATLEICPPEGLVAESEKLMRETALKAHKILRLGDYSRMDCILDAEGKLFFLEVNTLPGMTPTSLLPQEAAVHGIPYGALCERIITLAQKRFL
jgi:D-alanine-D-alanine ligase